MARKTTSTKKSTPRKASSARKESPVVKQRKPIFSASTLITVLLAISIGAYAFYLNNEKKNEEAEATPVSEESVYVVDAAKSGIVTSIEIKPADGETLKVVRGAENAWALELPSKAEADQGLVEAAASQISALLVVNQIDGDPGDFGLDQPAYVITIGFDDGKTLTLEVGDSTVTNSGYYVRVDKKKMMIVSLSGIDSLINLAFFPPYLNTPTPTALPATETPVPPTEEVSTPEVTVTPTP